MKYAVMIAALLMATACSNEDDNCPCDTVTVENVDYYIDSCKTKDFREDWKEVLTPSHAARLENQYPCVRFN